MEWGRQACYLHTSGVPSPWTTPISHQPAYVLVKHIVLRAMLNTFGNKKDINKPTYTIDLLSEQRNSFVFLKSSYEKTRTEILLSQTHQVIALRLWAINPHTRALSQRHSPSNVPLLNTLRCLHLPWGKKKKILLIREIAKAFWMRFQSY